MILLKNSPYTAELIMRSYRCLHWVEVGASGALQQPNLVKKGMLSMQYLASLSVLTKQVVNDMIEREIKLCVSTSFPRK